MVELIKFINSLAENINSSNRENATNFMMIVLALAEKGLISLEDILRFRAHAIHLVEQEWEAKARRCESRKDAQDEQE